MALNPNDSLVQQYGAGLAKTAALQATVSRTSGATGVTTPMASPTINPNPVPRTPAPQTSPGLAGSAASAAPGQSSTSGEWTMPGITDPSWFAVSRGYQLSADTASQNAALQRANLEAQGGLTRGDIQYGGEVERRNVGSDAEGRGILRSGEYERNLAEQMRQEQSRLNQLDLTQASGQSSIEQQLASQMSDLRRQFAEQGQTAAQQQYIREGTQQAQMAAQQAQSNPTAAPAGTALDAKTGQPLNGGLYLDDKGNYYSITNGQIKNVGWDVVDAMGGTAAAQKLGAQNSLDFRKSAGVTW